MLKIYRLMRIGRVKWDEQRGILVRATDEREARKIAAANSGDEGEAVWFDSSQSSCSEIRPSVHDVPSVIIRDFKAG